MSVQGVDDDDLGENGGGAVTACCVVFIFSCTLVLVLRFWSLHVRRRPVSMEDWILIPAWIFMIGMCVTGIYGVQKGGVGRHEAWIRQNDPKALASWAKVLFLTEIFYGVLIPIEKTSILLLYLRLFTVYRWFRFLILVLIAYIWMWGVSEVIVAIVQCIPVEYQWNKHIEGGHCINQLAYYRWVSVPNVIHDIVMLIVPMPMVWNLQVQWQKKGALSIVFVLGSFGCVASFVRLYFFFQLDAFSDRTWASIQLLSWTIAEPGVILICACLPAVWPLLKQVRWLRDLLSTTSGGRTSGNTPGDVHSGMDSHSQHRMGGGGLDPWPLPSRSLVRGNESFIPLTDMGDDRGLAKTSPPSESKVASLPPTEDGLRSGSWDRGQGIQVTREFTVTAAKDPRDLY